MNDRVKPQLKGLRIGHVSERGGINAVRSLLESKGLVVDEVDGRSDYGRDLNVDITNAAHLTGGIFGVQVKGGRSFLRRGRWVIPASPSDWEYWRSSTVPIIGLVWDPQEDKLRWVNLTQRARAAVTIDEASYEYETQNDQLAEVVVNDLLDNATFSDFIDRVASYLHATSSTAFLELLSSDDDTRRHGVLNCWTLGRWDPRPFILLRHVLPTLTGQSLVDGITVLAHSTSHPDIAWTPRNWISKPVEEEVQKHLVWTPDELVALVHSVEMLEDVTGWERGGVGQSLWSIISIQPDCVRALRRAVKVAVEERKMDAAVRLLVCFQWLVEDPGQEIRILLAEVPELDGHEHVNWLVEVIDRDGRVVIY